VTATDEQLNDLPKGLSLYDPLLRHEVKEALEAGGEAYVSRDPEGAVNGLFIYDSYEATGTIFTKSKEAFDHFYGLKPSSYIFSELEAAEYLGKSGTSGSWTSTKPRWTTGSGIASASTTMSGN